MERYAVRSNIKHRKILDCQLEPVKPTSLTMYHSLSIFVVFVVLGSAMGRPNKEEWEALKEKCIAESGVDPELVKGRPSSDQPVDDKVKCFSACIMKEHKWFKEDGTYDLERAISKIPDDVDDKEKVIADITECSQKKGSNDCDTAYEIKMCMREKKVPFRHHGHGHHDHGHHDRDHHDHEHHDHGHHDHGHHDD